MTDAEKSDYVRVDRVTKKFGSEVVLKEERYMVSWEITAREKRYL